MTALDQAFIRAYTRQGLASPSTSPEQVRSVPIDDALLESASEESTDKSGDVTADEMAEAVAEAMARTPANAVVEEPGPLETDQIDKGPVVPEVSCNDNFAALLGTARVERPFSECRIDTAHNSVPPNAAIVSKESQAVAPENRRADDRSGEFLPLLRVERFVWPEESLRMNRQAADQLGLITDSLSLQLSRERKVVGIGAHAGGQGCTTILLSAARRLGGYGFDLIVVDADFGNPCLGERLGIACRIGWDEVLAVGEPLEEAVIVSQRDRLALLPLKKGRSGENDASDGPPDLGAVTRRLREHYDLVLVDLGELNARTVAGNGRCRPIKEAVDGVLLVRDVRNRMQSGFDEASQLLREAGLVELGVTENFV